MSASRALARAPRRNGGMAIRPDSFDDGAGFEYSNTDPTKPGPVVLSLYATFSH
jgi:hypothetical protein